MEREKQEEGRLLIIANAPGIWKDFTSLIEQEVKKLAEAFRGQESGTLQFAWDLADKIVVTNPSNRTSFAAQWNPGELVIKLAFTQQLLGLEGAPAGHDQIDLVATPESDVAMIYSGITGPDRIAELLLKRLLKPATADSPQ